MEDDLLFGGYYVVKCFGGYVSGIMKGRRCVDGDVIEVDFI